ncbi:MAG: T9SS type A sorting domain-containing protein [Lentimicrobium sp.]
MKSLTFIFCSCLISLVLQAQINDSLVFYCTFDNVNAITNPVAGPGGTFNANPQTNFTTGQVGNAYLAIYNESDLVSFPKEIIPPDRGCVEFWGRLFDMPEYVNYNWGFCPAFFRTSNEGESRYMVEFNGNNGHEGAGLCGRAGTTVTGQEGTTATVSWGEYQSFSSILGDVNAWHHYALVWDIDGVPGVSKSLQVFLDGIPVGKCDAPYFAANYCPLVAMTPTIGDVKIITFQMNQGSVAIDELKIWNYAKTQFIEQAYIYTVLNDRTICKNDSTSFEVKAVGIPPIQYQWQKDGVHIPGALDSVLNFPLVKPEDAGEYRCIATNNYGTDTSNVAMLAVEFATPTTIQGFTEVFKYQVSTYSVSIQDGHTYEFLVEGGNMIDGTVNSVTVHWGTAGQGYIKLIETSELGCKADNNILSVSIGSLGIDDSGTDSYREQIADCGFTAYPNPFTALTTFFYTLTGSSQVTIRIYNAYGKLIDTPVNTSQQKGEQRIEWDAGNLPAGIYFYTFLSGTFSENGKIVLVK